MKIERINENQIRCTLSSFDLSVRNLNLGELAYGSEKARNLFREMIQKASNEVGFDAEDIPLMVEAIPLSNESVMLVITKIEDPEELDTRFSKFSQMSDEDSDSIFNGISSEFLEGADVLMELLKQNLAGLPGQEGMSAPATPQPEDRSDTPSVQTRIYRFESLDQVTAAAKVVGHVYQGTNILFKKPDSSQYFLVLSSADVEPLIFSRTCNILAEYGEKVRQQTATEAYYREHYEVIIRQQALQKLMLV